MDSRLANFIFGTGKAVDRGPDPGERVPDIYGQSGRPGQRVINKSARRHAEAYGGTDAIDWVRLAVNKYARTTYHADYHFERDGKRLRMPGEPGDARSHPMAPLDLVNLLRRPNPFMDYTEHIELSIIDLLLAGEFFWLKFGLNPDTGKPLALYRISPALMDIEPNEQYIGKYIYNPPGGGEPIEYHPAEILHVKLPNPHDPYRGLGVISGGPRVYDIELALTEHTANFYENGTRLSGVASTDRSIPDQVMQKLRRQFNAMFAGKRNVGQVAFLERGLRWQSISANAQEAQLLEASKWGMERVMYNFEIPLPLVGLVGGSTDRQAVREAQRIWANEVMRPFLDRFQSQVSFGLTSAWDIDYVVDYEYVMPIEDKLDLAEALAALPGIQVKDVRRQVDLPLLGEANPELSWIDDLVLNLPGQPREDGGHPDPNLGSEGGRPPKRENTKPIPRDPANIPASAAVVAPGGTEKALSDALGDLRKKVENGT